MFKTIEEIINENNNSTIQIFEQSQYFLKFFNSFQQNHKNKLNNKKEKCFTLFIDEFREQLNLSEFLLFNALRNVHKDYNFKYEKDLFNFSKQDNITSFYQIFDSLDQKGYISVIRDSKYRKIGKKVIHDFEKSTIIVKCLNPYGKVVNNYEI